ncbi:MAG TPA: DNA polymerase III subunit alpha [Acidimicrobiia bacterium]
MPRLRTGYSFRAAAGSLEECMSRVQECGWPVAPITDRASTFGWVRWSKLAAKNDLRPVFGVELAVAKSVSEKKPAVDHWTFIARDTIAPINKLVELATEQFRYQPLLSYAQANAAAKEVFAVCGRRVNFDQVDPDAVFYGLQPGAAKGHVRRAVKAGMKIVATSDNFFPRKDDQGFYEVTCGRGASTQTYDQHVQTDEEWMASVGRAGLEVAELQAALEERNKIWEGSTAKLQKAELVHPPRPKPLREMCEDGARKLGVDLTDPVYKARLDRELELIRAKEFEDYFFLVADICLWARKEMAVGPARGSSCGSLVCYLLEITTVDPIPFGLIFERFIDINRADLPDIDIDFSDVNRHKVFTYMERVYGQERVARLGTVAMFKARSALQEAGAALRVPRWKCDKVAEGLVERSSADSRATDTLEDTLLTTSAGKEVMAESPEILIAGRMEGHPRHYSQHAAGVVVADQPISNYVAVDHRTNATMCDKKDAEDDLNLLKIDALGLTQLSVFEDALDMIGMTMEELQKVPTDDQAAFDVLNRKEFSGVFQWNGNALQSLTNQIHVDRFDDIVAISALARPGPLATGGSTQWAVRRAGGAVPPGMHPMLDELTQDTYGVVVYQEQVMRIVREMGGLSWEDTSLIRKAMSRRLGNEFFEQFKRKFVAGAKGNGVDEAIAAEIWDQINTFGSWAFNKSHAVAYGFISYWCCWLKAHHPFEFAAATLSHESDPSRQIQILREMRDEGYDYLPVDAEHSTDSWKPGFRGGKKVLVGPLQNVKGIGPKMVNAIIGARARGEAMPDRAKKLLTDPKTELDSLFPIRDAIQRIMPDPMERNITSRPLKVAELTNQEDALVFVTPIKINPRDENEEIKVAKRGGQLVEDGKTKFVQLRVQDDTGTIMAKVNRFNYERIGQQIVDRGRPGKALWALKGKVFEMSGDFRILSVKQARYIGDIDKGAEN